MMNPFLRNAAQPLIENADSVPSFSPKLQALQASPADPVPYPAAIDDLLGVALAKTGAMRLSSIARRVTEKSMNLNWRHFIQTDSASPTSVQPESRQGPTRVKVQPRLVQASPARSNLFGKKIYFVMMQPNPPMIHHRRAILHPQFHKPVVGYCSRFTPIVAFLAPSRGVYKSNPPRPRHRIAPRFATIQLNQG